MDCSEFADRIAPYLDAQLGPAETEQLEGHLAHCRCCSDLVGVVSQQHLQAPDLPAAVSSRLADPHAWAAMDARLAREMERVDPPTTHTLTRPWMMAYAAALLMAMLWGAHGHSVAQKAEERASVLQQQIAHQQRLLEVEEATRPSPTIQYVNHTPHRSRF